MQLFKATDSSYSYSPDLLFTELLLAFLKLCNFLKQVTIIGEVHHNEKVSLFINKSFFVSDNARVLYRCKYTNLIQCILSLFH